MNVITQPAKWGKADERLKHWGKKVLPADIALNQKAGFALGGKFVKWTSDVSLATGEYLVVAYESGTKKNRTYHYSLIENFGGTLEAVYPEKILEIISAQAPHNKSTLYAFAVYIATKHNLPLTGPVQTDSPRELARKALLALPPAERFELVDEVLALGPVTV